MNRFINDGTSVSKETRRRVLFTLALLAVCSTPALAGDGTAAISNAVSSIQGYWTEIKKLIYAIGGVVGLIGGLRIYNKWTNGDQDINKEIMGWGGACLFLLLMPSFVDSFFKP
ncbi:DUF4134 family protein [Ornithobacterium rhinotracheale]|uniref:DUF4134 family protein n=1 Tax=Ornithobacterium rhinotracheale TaxID=28251 RepID=UPI003FA479D8